MAERIPSEMTTAELVVALTETIATETVPEAVGLAIELGRRFERGGMDNEVRLAATEGRRPVRAGDTDRRQAAGRTHRLSTPQSRSAGEPGGDEGMTDEP